MSPLPPVIPIKYRDFWDVPRIFLVPYEDRTFLFDCAFDEELDDYPESYKVYLLPHLAEEDLPRDWTTLRQKATAYLGEVPVGHVQFDATTRQSISTAVLEQFIDASPSVK